MITSHIFNFENSRKMELLASDSVHLAVTSPPYPMIEMWDDSFIAQEPKIKKAFSEKNPIQVFEMMHGLLDEVWEDLYRVLVDGGIACINIGDAVRTVNDRFHLFPNHARILSAMVELGFTPLPAVIWRKQTNAPNKFMGSGMFPAGAYVTLEHEYILIFRKGEKRMFSKSEGVPNRRTSAFFWEERNNWFSDVWFDLKGAVQKIDKDAKRKRSGAYPFELPYRLINMYSLYGDVVLDPFAGTGTTACAAAATARNSVNYEIEGGFKALIESKIKESVHSGARRLLQRLTEHGRFISGRVDAEKPVKHINKPLGYPVVTRQESEQMFYCPVGVQVKDDFMFNVDYRTLSTESLPYELKKHVKTDSGIDDK